MYERDFQRQLICELRIRFPGCVILKNDSAYLQGVPDLTIFYNDRWAMLEVKASTKSKRQPNQDYFIELLNGMSFAAYISLENEEEVLRALQSAFEPCRTARFSKR